MLLVRTRCHPTVLRLLLISPRLMCVCMCWFFVCFSASRSVRTYCTLCARVCLCVWTQCKNSYLCWTLGRVVSFIPSRPHLKNQSATFQNNYFRNSNRKRVYWPFWMPQYMQTTHSIHSHSKLLMAVKCHALQVGNEIGS